MNLNELLLLVLLSLLLIHFFIMNDINSLLYKQFKTANNIIIINPLIIFNDNKNGESGYNIYKSYKCSNN